MTEPTTLLVPTRVRGRVLVRPAASGGRRPLLVGFHGYGEGADATMDALTRLPGAERFHLAAVQGLNRFYRRRTGEVVASWMTRQDREAAIDDNVEYVGRAVSEVIESVGEPSALVYLGFSQGTAMAFRAAVLSGHRSDAVVSLGSDVPPELAGRDLSGLPPVLIGKGTEDAAYPERQLAADVALLEQAGASVEVCRYDGGHEWADSFLEAVDGFLRRVLGARYS